MHHCPDCGRDFGKYSTPGQCPLCGAWEMIRCVECGYHGAASYYLESDFKCPRCGRETAILGGPVGTKWVIVGLVTVAIVVVTVMVILITR
jgi:hypothetical protein